MKTKKTGTLYGIGVGPGDPELITLKAARILRRVDLVFAAASTKNSYSLAVSIATPHIPESTDVRMLAFPMTSDRTVAGRAWEENAAIVIRELEKGLDVAFLTLGDSMTYSTYGYIVRHIRVMAPHVTIKTVPGITSYQAAASRLNLPLVEGEESLLIVSGVHGGDRIRELAKAPENIVCLKAYRNIEDISAALGEAGLMEKSVGITGCGLPKEEVIEDIREFRNRPPDYWTLIIAKKSADNGTAEK